jgi:hypothetical protein
LAKLKSDSQDELDTQKLDAQGELETQEDIGDPEDDLDELDDLAEFDELEEFDDLEEFDENLVAGHDPSAPITATPGCAVSFFLDNKRHHAVCLAVIGDELLLEHKGASRCVLFTGKVAEIVPRLRFGVASATIIVGGLKACRYRSVPKKWLQQMIRTGRTWKGIERGGALAPRPTDLLKDDGQLELF